MIEDKSRVRVEGRGFNMNVFQPSGEQKTPLHGLHLLAGLD